MGTGYTNAEKPATAGNSANTQTEHYTLAELKQQYTDYVSVKFNEIEEQRLSWRYYHTVQWTAQEIAVMEARKQPVITFNRSARKINGLIGIIQKLRADPKAFPRNPNADGDAEVVTVCLREVFDASRMEDLEPLLLLDGAVHGYAVAELGLEKGDLGDPEITIAQVDAKTFFYDPRSLKPDFSDSRFKGVSKWCDIDEIDELIPGAANKIKEIGGMDTFWTQHDTDRAPLWVNNKKQYRLNEHWYKYKSKWYYCIYVGSTKLAHGPSPFVDVRNRSIPRYIGFAAGIDQDGDRYGFMRLLKGPQDALNQHRSKAMWIMNTRQIIAEKGAVENIEVARREAARADGYIEHIKGFELEIQTADQEFLQQTEYYKEALSEIENFGPNPAIVGTDVKARSGRALAMMQQSGLAELGPFLANYRAFKFQLYRCVWQAIRKFWKAERWIRVTDDPKSLKFLPINQPKIVPNPLYGSINPPMPSAARMPPQMMQPQGMPMMPPNDDNADGSEGMQEGAPQPPMQQPTQMQVPPQMQLPYQVQMLNDVSALDVDIIVEEGPDTSNVMGDIFDILMSLVQNNVPIPPQVILEMSALPNSVKQKLIQMMSQPPSPEQQQTEQVKLAGMMATVEKLRAEIDKIRADTDKTRGPDTAKTRAQTAHQFALVDKTSNEVVHAHTASHLNRLSTHSQVVGTIAELLAPKDQASQ